MRSLRTALMLLVLLLGALTASAGAAPVRDSALDVNSCGIDEFEGTALDTHALDGAAAGCPRA